MKQFYILLTAFFAGTLISNSQALGQAMCFDGLNDFAPVYRATETGIFGTNANNDSFTIEFWVKDNGSTGKHMYSKHYDSGSEKQGYFIERDGTTGFVTAGIANNTNNWSTVTGSIAINDGSWHHVAVTFDVSAGILVLYVDAEYEGDALGITPVFGNNVDARLASSEHENTFFGGAFDEVKIWNTVRSQNEVSDLKNIQLDTSSLPAGLIQYFQCNEGTVGADNWVLYQLLDHTGNGRPGDLWNVSRWGACSNWVDSVPAALLSVDTFENTNIGLSLYPNPANNVVKINGLKSNKNYTIHNALGAIVKKGTVANNTEIAVSDLAKGLYFLKLEDNRTLKFIKN